MATIDTKAHILNAAIEAIETHGLHQVTTRIIADIAGVNNAALHYHFGTKDKLVEIALQQTIRHADQDLADLLSMSEDWKDDLFNAIRYLLEGSVRYPNIVRAHLYETVPEVGVKNPFLKEFHNAVERIIRHVAHHRPDADLKRIQSAVHTALSAGLFTALSPGVLTEATGVHVDEPTSLDSYLRFLTDMICNA